MFRGQIVLWWGAVVTIPAGWILCDGNNGTPDLRGKFVPGAGGALDPGDTGGAINHNHDFTGDGHNHELTLSPVIQVPAGFFSPTTSTNPATGTTDNEDGRPPYHALCFIMKVYDDPNTNLELPWPYAAKAIVQFAMLFGNLIIYLTFRHKMNTDIKPALPLWKLTRAGVPDIPDFSTWLDPWTMQLGVVAVAEPAWITVEYDGPDANLETVWHKMWEPWGPILGFVIA